jgi:hypothetical protein
VSPLTETTRDRIGSASSPCSCKRTLSNMETQIWDDSGRTVDVFALVLIDFLLTTAVCLCVFLAHQEENQTGVGLLPKISTFFRATVERLTSSHSGTTTGTVISFGSPAIRHAVVIYAAKSPRRFLPPKRLKCDRARLIEQFDQSCEHYMRNEKSVSLEISRLTGSGQARLRKRGAVEEDRGKRRTKYTGEISAAVPPVP